MISTTLAMIPAGIALSATLPGEDLLIGTKGFLTSEDGNEFLTTVEAMWGYFESALQPTSIQPPQVEHLLAIVERNRRATIYCNELKQVALIQVKKPIEAGAAVFKDDISDIAGLHFQDSTGNEITIPSDAGVVLILSVRWRKCVYYDLGPLAPNGIPRSDDLTHSFGMCLRQMTFEDLYSIPDFKWEAMFQIGWFPFAWMGAEDRQKLIQFADRRAEPTALLEEICHKFQAIILDRASSWARVSFFQNHLPFIESATKHYLASDFLSAIQVLYPRIEGLMRDIHLVKKPGEKPQQRRLVETLVAEKRDDSIFFPSRFRDYLLKFYFRNFDPSTGDVSLSRHTVAHGASVADDYTLIRASLGFMIFDQIFYFLLVPETLK